jgi:hypothetical protein
MLRVCETVLDALNFCVMLCPSLKGAIMQTAAPSTGEVEPFTVTLTHCPPFVLEHAARLEGQTRIAQHLNDFRTLDLLLSRVQLRQWWWARDPQLYPPFVRCDWPHPIVLEVQNVNIEHASIVVLSHDPPFEALSSA